MFRFETSDWKGYYWVPLKVLFTIPFEAFWNNKFNPLAEAPMCGRWSLNKNSGREIAMDENTRTLKTNGPFNREEKRRAQPQTLLNLWSGSNIIPLWKYFVTIFSFQKVFENGSLSNLSKSCWWNNSISILISFDDV